MDCECFDLAIEEFKKAIYKRPDDEMRARTYGMHFIRYYPHRELGIIYYQTGQTEQAIQELEQSLDDCPTSKAKYFLNEARKTLLLENDLDHLAPKIYISTPNTARYFTNQSKITIEGTAEDDQFVSALSINGKPEFIELSAKTIRFTHTISLEPGKNKIVIAASDFLDRQTETTLEILVDKTGPMINLAHSPIELAHAEGRMFIQGLIIDESGVDMLQINGKPVYLKKEEITEFSHWVPLTKDMKRISFLALDIAGNETRGYIDLASEVKVSQSFNSTIRPINLINKYSQSQKPYTVQIASLDDFIYYSMDSYNREKENEDQPFSAALENSYKPSIKMEPLPRTTIYDEIHLNGKIQYYKNISNIKIFVNNKPVPMTAYSTDWLDKVMRRIKGFFGLEEVRSLILGQFVELDIGENKIVIAVYYDNEVITSEPIYIVRKKDEMREQKYRLVVSIFPVNDISEAQWFSTTQETKDYVFVKLNETFVKQKRFWIVDRKWLEKILFEQKLAASDLTDKERAIELGRLVNAESIISSSMRMQKGKSIEIISDMIDTETSLYMCSDDIYLQGDGDQMITEAVEKLAIKIRQHFPLCKGQVLAKKEETIKVDIGQKDGICAYTKMLVYREDEWDSIVLSNARVETVFDDYSSALLSNTEKQDEVNKEDLVITK